jgi:hypothetical protein
MFDSTADTLLHKKRILELMANVIEELLERAVVHDNSKLGTPEKQGFDEFTPRLRDTPYGSAPYYEALAEMKPFLDLHYGANRHHPQFHADGIHGMSLLDLIEMLADWRAGTERSPGGNILESIAKNRERFGYGDELAGVLVNTVSAMGWDE